MKKVANRAPAKKIVSSKKRGYGSSGDGVEMQDRNSFYAAKASKFANSPSASTRTRTALQRPGSLKQPTGNERNSSSAMGGMYPKGKKVVKGSKYK